MNRQVVIAILKSNTEKEKDNRNDNRKNPTNEYEKKVFKT